MRTIHATTRQAGEHFRPELGDPTAEKYDAKFASCPIIIAYWKKLGFDVSKDGEPLLGGMPKSLRSSKQLERLQAKHRVPKAGRSSISIELSEISKRFRDIGARNSQAENDPDAMAYIAPTLKFGGPRTMKQSKPGTHVRECTERMSIASPILAAAAEKHSISLQMIESKQRDKFTVDARASVIIELKDVEKWTFREIGELLSDRDYSVISRAYSRGKKRGILPIFQAPNATVKYRNFSENRSNDFVINRSIAEHLITAICASRKISKQECVGKSRHRPSFLARVEASVILRNLFHWPLSDIGRVLGGRDHTTIINAIDNYQKFADLGYKFHVLDELSRMKESAANESR